MKDRLYLFYSSVLILYIINRFLSSASLDYVIGLLAIAMLVISFKQGSTLFKVLGGAFMASGSLMYVTAGLSIKGLPLFFTTNMQLLAFLMVLPWINSVVHVGKYDQHINGLMKEKVHHLGSLYSRSVLTTYILMTFLNLSAVNLSQSVLLKSMKNMSKAVRDNFISRATIRAFTMALIWSPMEIIVAITVDATGVSYLIYLPWLLGISFFILLVDSVIGRYRFKSIAYEPALESAHDVPIQKIIQEILKLLAALILFLTIVLSLSHLFQLNFILTVTLVIIPFSCLWAIIIKRWYLFKVFGFEVWKQQTNKTQNFVILFITLAFFTNSLNETTLLQYVQRPFVIFDHSPLMILILILATYFFMAMIGVHPVGTIAILLEVLAPLFHIFNPVAIGIVLIVGALATSSSSTFGVVLTLTSINTEQNPYRITLRNLPFTLLYGAIGIAVAMMII
ncbi:hypothetical protein HXA34_19085 [Salipaludibacillus agaradhaerens]|uniref:hypothetical protein n=1 Tax=Salipaludibacillus agaradhaerens TaxID=76935 RepID=UPI002151EE58|nr:hypothetical protein [Salipaludibacillus agaradhaerens]MCR6108409.1 hypothetical protein [Salipaludibacillus agaradhaerens]MCR6120431.1 hypothetical protein [Salipaludibacillus agaradhaerens]UJW59439.1 hypothetical protein HXZ66_19510 [Bacillus sp. A116_S68]